MYAQKDFDNCKARIEGRYSQIQPERLARPPKSTSAPTPASKLVQTNATAQKSHGKTATPKSVEPPKKDDNWWEAAALFEFIQKAVNNGQDEIISQWIELQNSLSDDTRLRRWRLQGMCY